MPTKAGASSVDMRSNTKPSTSALPNDTNGTESSGKLACAYVAASATLATVAMAAATAEVHLAYGRGRKATISEPTIGARMATRPRRDRLVESVIVTPLSYTPTMTKTNARTAMPTTAQV